MTYAKEIEEALKESDVRNLTGNEALSRQNGCLFELGLMYMHLDDNDMQRLYQDVQVFVDEALTGSKKHIEPAELATNMRNWEEDIIRAEKIISMAVNTEAFINASLVLLQGTTF